MRTVDSLVRCVEHELDSFMYQTVGHEAVALIAQAAELPLVRRQIQGRSTVVSMEYSVCADDEVEDLLELLSDVKVWTDWETRETPFLLMCLKHYALGLLASLSPGRSGVQRRHSLRLPAHPR